ncbi:MAG: transposase, partial [Chloroflexaceae bacterium]|nr:transposase [Chloroflexaceae bacterium]
RSRDQAEPQPEDHPAGRLGAVPRANVAERFWSQVKQYRRVATRYEKKAANFLGFVQLACVRLLLPQRFLRPVRLSKLNTKFLCKSLFG